jgi:hypothetical protein
MVKALPRDNFQRTVRILAALTVAMSAAVLYVGGAQPVAVGLFPAPWDKLAHLLTFAVVGMAAGLAGGMRGWRMALCCVAGACWWAAWTSCTRCSCRAARRAGPTWPPTRQAACWGLLCWLCWTACKQGGRLTHH